MGVLELDPEEPGEVAELVALGPVRIALAGEDQRVEVLARLEAEAVAEGLLEEAEVEADVVADERGVTDELQELLGSVLRASARP